jgi:hypothetical protein
VNLAGVHYIQTGFRAHYELGDHSQDLKRPECETDQLYLMQKLRICSVLPVLTLYVLMACSRSVTPVTGHKICIFMSILIFFCLPHLTYIKRGTACTLYNLQLSLFTCIYYNSLHCPTQISTLLFCFHSGVSKPQILHSSKESKLLTCFITFNSTILCLTTLVQ